MSTSTGADLGGVSEVFRSDVFVFVCVCFQTTRVLLVTVG